MRKILILALLIPAMLVFDHVSTGASESFEEIAAQAALLVEADSGMVLFEHNSRRRHPPDALAKVMTMLLVITAFDAGSADPDEIVEMTESAHYNIDSSSTTQGIMPGEEMSLLDLLYCAYLGGANEACNLLAERISGNVDAFVAAMNSRARELGCSDTNFANANGLYSDSHYTTAADQYIVFREALRHPLFAEISGTYSYSIDESDLSGIRNLYNSNGMLNPSSKYHYKPCTSGMAPYIASQAADVTIDGGYSFISIAELDGLSLICVVLGSDAVLLEDNSVELQNLTEARRLFEWGYASFSWRTVLSTTELICKAPVLHGDGADFVNLRPEKSITLLLSNDVPDEYFEKPYIIYSVENNDVLYAPVYSGDVLGEVMVVARDGSEHGPVLLVANTDVDLHRLQFIRMQVSDMLSSTTARFIIWLLVIIVLGYIALVVRHNVLRRKRLREIAEAKERLRDDRQSIAKGDDR